MSSKDAVASSNDDVVQSSKVDDNKVKQQNIAKSVRNNKDAETSKLIQSKFTKGNDKNLLTPGHVGHGHESS